MNDYNPYIMPMSQPPANYGSMPLNYGTMPATYGNMPGNFGTMPASYSAMSGNNVIMPAEYTSAPNNYGVMPATYGSMPDNFGVMSMGNAALPMKSDVLAEQEKKLEEMYPKTYRIINPHCEKMCDNLMAKYGEDYIPTTAEMEKMIDEIYDKVESEVEKAAKQANERQIFGGGRRLLRDFIAVLLIGNLIRRRRRPFFPGYFGYPFY